jgi:predicted  nucleic acid-binding Zn-ribbon protein
MHHKIESLIKERNALQSALKHAAGRLESLEKITRERDALRAALHDASSHLHRSNEKQHALEKQIDALQQENRRLRVLVAQACSTPRETQSAAPALDVISVLDFEPEFEK